MNGPVPPQNLTTANVRELARQLKLNAPHMNYLAAVVLEALVNERDFFREAVLELIDGADWDGPPFCPFDGCEQHGETALEGWDGTHGPNCPVTIARAGAPE